MISKGNNLILFPCDIFVALEVRGRATSRENYLGHIAGEDVGPHLVTKEYTSVWEASRQVTLNRLLWSLITVPKHKLYGKIVSPDMRVCGAL